MRSKLQKLTNFFLKKKMFIALLIGLASTSNVHAQWKWEARTIENGRLTFNGEALSKELALQEMKAACSMCPYLEEKSLFLIGGGVTYYYGPAEDIPIEGMTEWEYSPYGFGATTDVFPSFVATLAHYKKDSKEGCPAATVQDRGGIWHHRQVYPYNPILWQTYCLSNLDYREDFGFCNDRAIQVSKYTNKCRKIEIEPAPQRRRKAICPEFMLVKSADVVNGTRKLGCLANVLGNLSGPKARPDSCNTAGNPCSVSTGDKITSKTDFSTSSVSFTRHYNSLQTHNTLTIGKAWRHSYQDKLLFNSTNLTGYLSPEGRHLRLIKRSQERFVFGDGQRPEQFSEIYKLGNEWHVLASSDGKRIYNAEGDLIRIESSSGQVVTLTYNLRRQLKNVIDNYGQGIELSYRNSLISSITQPDGGIILYNYDNTQNLVSVSYPDGTPGDSIDNPTVKYHYEDTRFIYHLTGITDENGNRYATYAYDANGKAISTEHAQTTNPVGQEKFELDYQGAN